MEGLILPFFAFFFSLLLFFIYIPKEKVNLVENYMYSAMIMSILIDSIIVTSLQGFGRGLISKGALFTIEWLNKIDFFILVIYISCLFMYIAIITIDKCSKNYKKLIKTVSIIDIICFIIISFGTVSVLESNGRYTAGGSAPIITIGICAIYILITISIVIFNYKKVDRRHTPILYMIMIIIALIILCKSNPYIIVISLVLTFVNYIMYFTIENPDVRMLREVTLAKDEAEKANRAKSDFLSSMSHEIRTPLNAIVGLSEDISTFKDKVPHQVVEDTVDIRNASNTLLEIVGNILDINKIESEKMDIIEVPYNFKEEITSLAHIAKSRIEDKPIKYTVNIAEDIPDELLGDKIHVKQIINNILTNAIKYTNEGEVELNIKCINKERKCLLIISVRDTGIGIKKESIEKLFSKFERLEVERNTTVEGTGLGLAITKSLVELMGGKINVESTYGKGSLFVVQIPQKISRKKATTNKTEIKKKEINKIEYKNKRILVVDDNALNIKVARRALSDFKLIIDEAKDGQECIEKVKTNKYDLILMDIMMPIMSGEEALIRLKEDKEFKTPVIALTADAVAGSKEKYISKGFIDYIAKPFTKDQIKEKIDIIFSKK